MKHFNKLRDQLRNENTPLPSEFSWEEMGQGVIDKVNTKNSKLNTKLHKYKTTIFILIGIIFLLSLVSIKYYTQTQREVVSEKSKNNLIYTDRPMATDEKINNNTPSISNSSKANLQQEIETEVASIQSTNIQKNNASQYNPNNNKITKACPTTSNIHKFQESNVQTLDSKDKAINDATSASTNIPNVVAGSEFLVLSNQMPLDVSEPQTYTTHAMDRNSEVPSTSFVQNSANPSLQDEAMHVASTFPNIASSSIKIPSLPILKQIAFDSNIRPEFTSKISSFEKEPSSNIKWSLAVGAGLNDWKLGVPASDSLSMYRYTNTVLGQNYFLHAAYKLSNHVSLQSGLEYYQLKNKLDKELTTYKERKLTDVVLSYTVNPLTGNSTEQRGDTIVIDTYIRKVINYNNYNLLQIPISVLYEKRSKTWSYGLGIGCIIHILNNYEGKYATSADFKSYATVDDLYKKYNMSLQGNLFAKRYIYSNLYIGSSLRYSKSIGSWSNRPEQDLKPSILNGSLFVGIEF